MMKTIAANGIPADEYFRQRGRAYPPRRDRIGLMQFLTFFYLGGTERQVMNLTTGLDRSRFDVHMGCHGKVGALLEEATSRGIPVEEYAIKSLYNLGAMYARLRLARYLREHAIEIVHSYGFYSNLFAIPAARLAGAPVVIASIRDCGEALTPAQRRAQRMFCRMADCVLANAEGVRRWLVSEGYPVRKIQVIRNGIVRPMTVAVEERSKLRQELGLAPNTRLIAVCSRLTPMKGIEHFLDAASVVGRRRPDVRFLIIGGPSHIGNGGYKSELERYAASLGLEKRVIFTGFRTDVAKMLPEIDISVLPSLSEGLSNSLLEAMAAGVPVIATRVGGTPEAVEDGNTGLLVPPADLGALIRAMTFLLDNPQSMRRMGEEGRRRVLSRFSVERMIQETESLYFKLLSASRARVWHREVAMS
jgi:glycosyltransferase involved in cell wall biosynthesis